MPDKASLAEQLAGFRDGMVADGYDLIIEDVRDGKVRLRIAAGPDACADCLVPRNIMVPMLQDALRGVPGITAIEIAYPTD